MSTEQYHPFAGVITGDLVGSRADTDTLDAAIDVLRWAADDIARDTQTPALFDQYRGDGWQIVLPHGQNCLRAALRLVAALAKSNVGLTTRVALGIGPATLPKNHDIGAGYGAAFIQAGELLEAQEKAQRLSLPKLPGFIGAAERFLDWHTQNWNQTQAEALFETLRHQRPNHEQIASKLGISRQAIQQRLARTALDAILQTIQSFEADIEKLWQEFESSSL